MIWYQWLRGHWRVDVGSLPDLTLDRMTRVTQSFSVDPMRLFIPLGVRYSAAGVVQRSRDDSFQMIPYSDLFPPVAVAYITHNCSIYT